MLLSKSDGTSLDKHSKEVSEASYRNALSLGLPSPLPEQCRLAGLLHGIGKAISSYQSLFSGQPSTIDVSPQEAGWAVLASTDFNTPYNRDVLHSIYWHHAREVSSTLGYKGSSLPILESLSDSDIQSILSFVSSLGVTVTGFDRGMDLKVPDLFDMGMDSSSLVPRRLLIRSCVTEADWRVSSCMPPVVYVDPGVSSYSPPAGYVGDRFTLQESLARSLVGGHTSQVNAPAGFGKTLAGVLCSALGGKQVIWVVPRNVVAEGVYSGVLKELGALGISRSVELYLGSERKLCTDSSLGVFESDIVITNIDQFLLPTVNDVGMGRLYRVMRSDVIFDKCHEYARSGTGYSLLSAFVHCVSARHRFTSSRTVLLSATGMDMYKLWDGGSLITEVYPRRGCHYPSVHSKSYLPSLVNSLPLSVPLRGVFISNSVKNAQSLYSAVDLLVHSKYTDSDKSLVLEEVVRVFGKGGTGSHRVSSAPILEGVSDISFDYMCESVLSPESTLQRLGRLNRWGGSEFAEFVLYLSDDVHESGAIRTLYDRPLRDLWVSYLQEHLHSPMVLDDFYKLYDSFYEVHGDDVTSWLSLCVQEGLRSLNSLAPYKVREVSRGSKRYTGSSIRDPGRSYWVTMRDSFGIWLPGTDAFREPEFRFDAHLKQSAHAGRDWSKVLKELVSLGYDNFSVMYKRLTRGSKSDLGSKAKIWARDRGTPYPLRDRVYHRLGRGGTLQDVGLGIINAD